MTSHHVECLAGAFQVPGYSPTPWTCPWRPPNVPGLVQGEGRGNSPSHSPGSNLARFEIDFPRIQARPWGGALPGTLPPPSSWQKRKAKLGTEGEAKKLTSPHGPLTISPTISLACLSHRWGASFFFSGGHVQFINVIVARLRAYQHLTRRGPARPFTELVRPFAHPPFSRPKPTTTGATALALPGAGGP